VNLRQTPPVNCSSCTKLLMILLLTSVKLIKANNSENKKDDDIIIIRTAIDVITICIIITGDC